MKADSKDIVKKKTMTNEHLANERTLLAWVRTAIGVMAFGFVVVKFSLFLRQMAAITGVQAAVADNRVSGPVGICNRKSQLHNFWKSAVHNKWNQ